MSWPLVFAPYLVIAVVFSIRGRTRYLADVSNARPDPTDPTRSIIPYIVIPVPPVWRVVFGLFWLPLCILTLCVVIRYKVSLRR